MKRTTFHEALAATARISCCALLVSSPGCRSGASAVPDEQPRNEHDEEAAPAVIAEPDPYITAEQREAALAEPDPQRQALDACEAQLEAMSDQGQMRASESNERCCEMVMAAVSEWPPEGADERVQEASQHTNDVWNHARMGCCELLEWPGGACTPWGPPTPPATRGRLAQRGLEPGVLDLREPARAHAQQLQASAWVPEAGELQRAAVATWRGRMVNEHGSARVFEGLCAQLEALPGAAQLDAQERGRLRAFADEERLHGILCGAVVEALGGQARAPALAAEPFPRHADAASPLEAALRNLLSVSCLSETVAVALIGAERIEMPEGPLRELLTRIYADECGHAKFGWRLLPRLLADADAGLRERLGDYLALAFAELERHQLAHLPIDFVAPAGGEALGLCDGVAARELFYATVESVIVPGLEAQGLPARRAWARRGSAGQDRPRPRSYGLAAQPQHA